MSSSDEDNHENTTRKRVSLGLKTTQERKLHYRKLLNRIEEIDDSEDFGLKTVESIGDILTQVESIEDDCSIKVRYIYPDETLLDSLVISSVSDVLVKCVQAVNLDLVQYQSHEFASKIKGLCSINGEFEGENITNLLEDANHLVPKVPDYGSLYGAYDLHTQPQPKKKKERTKTKKETFERKEPEKLTKIEQTEKGIQEILTVMSDCLTKQFKKNSRKPVNYYDFIVDTDSYTQTIENMFYCSFLVKDGRIRISLDARNNPLIEPVVKHDKNEKREKLPFQMISAIAMPRWETFKKPGYLQQYNRELESQ